MRVDTSLTFGRLCAAGCEVFLNQWKIEQLDEEKQSSAAVNQSHNKVIHHGAELWKDLESKLGSTMLFASSYPCVYRALTSLTESFLRALLLLSTEHPFSWTCCPIP